MQTEHEVEIYRYRTFYLVVLEQLIVAVIKFCLYLSTRISTYLFVIILRFIYSAEFQKMWIELNYNQRNITSYLQNEKDGSNKNKYQKGGN